MQQRTDIPDRIYSRRIIRSLFIIIVLFLFTPLTPCYEPALAKPAKPEVLVIEVNDGDTVTVRIDGKEYRARLIGIDAPELGQWPWGERAKDHLIALMYDAGWKVLVETDVVKSDKYDRLLAYLWTQQGELINERMLLDGCAVLFTIPPNVKYANRFTKAEARARRERKGIWGTEGLRESPLEYREKHPRKEYSF